MSNKFKNIDKKTRTFYFLDDMIIIKNFEPNKIMTDENSCKKILI